MTGRDEKESVKVLHMRTSLGSSEGAEPARGEGQEGMPHKPAGEATGEKGRKRALRKRRLVLQA